MKQFSKIILFGLSLAALFALSGCNTMQGVGQDVEKAGEEIEEAAQ